MNTRILAIGILGAMLSGCALVSLNKAMSDSPDAAAAVGQIESGAFLEQIAREAPREDARIAAASKMNGEWPLCCIVMDRQQAKGVRLAAFERLVKLGKAETLLGKRSDLADTIVQAQSATEDAEEEEDTVEDLIGPRGRSTSGPRGAATAKKAGKTWAFPEEWRVKAVNTGNCSGIYLEKILLDETESMSMRIAVAQAEYFNLNDENIRQLTTGAAKDDGRKALVEALFASGKGGKKDRGSLSYNTLSEFLLRDKTLPFEDCQYVFSLLSKDKDANKLAKTLGYVVYRAEDAKKDSDAERFAMWAIANVGNSETLFKLVEDNGSKKKAAKYLVEAVKHMDDASLEKLLVEKYVKGSSFRRTPEVPYAAVSQIKDQAKKAAIVDRVIAMSAPEAAVRAKALSKVCASNPKDAYGIVWNWFFDTDYFETGVKGDVNVRELTDRQALAALLKQAMADRRNLARTEIVPSIKRAVFASAQRQFDALPADKREALVASVKARAGKLNGEGKTLVVGNYYVGMPLVGLFALEKTQDVKAVAKDWQFDSEGKNVIVTSIRFDSKNVYRATGIEKSECVISLPSKLGIAAFEMKATKIRRNTSLSNQIAEYTGDYSNSYTGGDVYWESENQNKEVLVTFWNDSGTMDIEELKD